MTVVSRRACVLLLLLALILSPFVVTQRAGATLQVGNRSASTEILNFSDLSGKRYATRGPSFTPAVFFFLSTECPIANRYTSRILAMEKAFKPLGVRFYAIYPNSNESEADIRQHAIDWGLTCPVVRDDGRLVKYFGITMTPEAALVGTSGMTLYRGRIDDNMNPEDVRSRDLATAILAMYAGRPVARPRTEPFGCPIRLLPGIMVAKTATASWNPTETSNGTPRIAIPEPALRGNNSLPAAANVQPVNPLTGDESGISGPDRPDASLKSVNRSSTLSKVLTLTESGLAIPEAPEFRSRGITAPSTALAFAHTASLPLSMPMSGNRPGESRRVATELRSVRYKTRLAPSVPKSEIATTSITYTRDVAPILFERCLPCHRQGEVAPFRIDTYEQAVAWAGQIQDAVVARRMPPWKAESHGEFHDEMRLSKREVAILTSWVNGGTPYGSATDMPPVPTFRKGWRLGEPDATLEMPDRYEVTADGRDVYRCFVIPTHFSEDRWVSGVEYQPGNTSVVHHVSAFIDTTGQARRLDEDSPGPGYTNPTPANGPGFGPVAGQLGGWVPGHYPRRLPTGVGIYLPKGADIVVEVHYHPSGRPETDRSRMGLYFAREDITKRLHVGDVSNVNFRIPAGAENYKVEASAFLPDDMTLLSISPHMHYTGRSMRVVATLPSGVTQVLVDVPEWDFRWQPSYRFKNPVSLPRRTRIDMVSYFDNSDKNPRNPNHPPKEMIYGEGSADEMCTVFLAYTLDHKDVKNDLPEVAVRSEE